tara:strand:- start:747 stop:1040 length:294 start_codon:yes stop_codon:yes gene_type:complete
MKIYFCKDLYKQILFPILLISLVSLKGNFLNAETFFEELQIDSTTKSEDDDSIIPTNPFQIVEMIRRHNSLNDATDPSDAIDNALKSFEEFEEDSDI